MSTFALALILFPLATALALIVAFLAYISIRYAPIIGRIFEEKPLFLPLRLAPEPGGQDVRFSTSDGLDLGGSYFPATTPSRVGVIVFCHEYLSDRWSFHPYLNDLRKIGYDIFTFDFRNHGESQCDLSYRPLQWVTDHELRDLQAALSYLRSRPDHDPAGFGLFGVSRGGSAALLAGALDPGVWGVVTDGAFATRGTMLAYILRWAEIYVSNSYLWRSMPTGIFRFVAWVARVRSERRLNCRFPDVEKAVARLTPRPWLMIHGEKDAYIGPDIARALFAEAGEPKEHWMVPKAKHNRSREIAPEAYAERVVGFLRRYAPRRELEVGGPAAPGSAPQQTESRAPSEIISPEELSCASAASGLVAPVSG